MDRYQTALQFWLFLDAAMTASGAVSAHRTLL
jgi:hypothetical protein